MVADTFIIPFSLKLEFTSSALFVDFNLPLFYQLWIGTTKKEIYMEGKFCSLAWNFRRNKVLFYRNIHINFCGNNSFHMTHKSVSCYSFSSNLKIGIDLTSYLVFLIKKT